MNRTRRRLCAATLLPALPLFAKPALADAPWPTRAVRIVVPFAPGGGTDIIARALGGALGPRLKQPVTVDNKPGASTIIGADSVAKADAQSHVLLVSGSTTFTVNPALRSRLPYDPARDLALVAMIAKAPLVLAVNTSAPWKTLPELLAAARAKPRGLAFATFGPGSGPQLAGALLALEAGVQWLEVPYKGSGPALTDLLGGQLQFVIDTVASAGPQVKAGKLRALAVLGPARVSELPGVASLAELRMPRAAFDAWYALAAPARMPAAARAVVEREVRAAMADPALQATVRQQAMQPVFIGSDALKPIVDEEIARYRMLMHRANIVVD